MKPPKRKMDWEGLKVRSRTKLTNGWFEIPAGTTFTVERNYGGLHLMADPCPHCGIRLRINKVPEFKVEIIEEETS